MNKQNLECENIINDTETESAPKTCNVIGIYGLQNRLKPEKWYIGQSFDIVDRWDRYKRLACKRQPKIYNALLKYGFDGFNKVVLEELANPTITCMDDRESHWMKFYNSVENGYNLVSGGKSNGKHSKETIEKMKGKRKPKKTPEQLKRMSDAQKGKTQSPETIEKRRQKLIGKKRPLRSKNWCEKISIAAKERYKDKTKNPNFGKITKEDTKEKIRMSLSKNRLGKIVVVQNGKII